MYFRCCRILLAAIPGLLLLAGNAGAEMGGREGRPTPFVGQLDIPTGECRFSIDVERISYLVTTVAGKYRLVRMLVDCRGEGAIALSATNDRLEMLIDDDREGGDGLVAGVLSLRQSDAAIWDAFDVDLRRLLAFPPEVRAGEPVYLFAYFAADEAQSMPRGFRFTIASLDEEVLLMNLATAARN